MHSYLKQELHIIFRFNIVEIYNLFKIRAFKSFIYLFIFAFLSTSIKHLIALSMHSQFKQYIKYHF